MLWNGQLKQHSHSLEAGKFEIQVLADLMSGERPLPGSQKAVFPLCPYVAEGERALVSASSCKDTNPIVGPHPHHVR